MSHVIDQQREPKARKEGVVRGGRGGEDEAPRGITKGREELNSPYVKLSRL
jgi:hypothetical protein